MQTSATRGASKSSPLTTVPKERSIHKVSYMTLALFGVESKEGDSMRSFWEFAVVPAGLLP